MKLETLLPVFNHLPKMEFPGGLLTGDNAGTLELEIKGSHTANISGLFGGISMKYSQ